MSVRIRTFFQLAGLLAVVPAARAQTEAIPFFDDTVVQQVNLTVGASDWATLLQNYESDTYYGATFTWNGILEEVGIRQHGHASRSPIKPNVDINFAYYSKKQAFLGLPFIVLKANNEDPSNLHEWLSMKLFRMMGFPAPREAPAQLYVNGQLFGFYTIVEHEDTAFLQRNFGESGGYLYEWEFQVTGPANAPVFYEFQNLGTDPSLYAPYVELKTDQTAPDLQTLCNLVQVINKPSSSTFSDADFIAALSQYIDPKSFLTYVATEQVLTAADGMVGGVVGMNNFDLYQFQGTTFYQVIPWDKGTTFSDWTRDFMYGVTLPININVLAQRLVGIPEYLNFYLGQVSKAANLLGGAGGWADNQITFEYGVIDTAASNDPNKQCMNYGVLYPCGTADFQNGVQYLHEFMATRSGNVTPEVQADGFQPVTTDPQISTAAMAAPSIPQSAITVIATPLGQAVPGALLNVTGANLGPAAQASGDSLPRSLANAYVAVEGVRAPLVTTADGQIELQIPWDLPAGGASVVVSVGGEMSNTLAICIQATMPTILSIVHQSDGNPVSNAEPAVAGEILVAYMAGLGDVNTGLSFGTAAPASPLVLTAVTPQVTLGGMPAYVISSGLSPGFVGLYQVTVVLPATLPQGGLANLTVTAGSSATSTSLALAGQ
ncbi:MAG: CotH kinase family protein [Bryobacteraceae bacterium]